MRRKQTGRKRGGMPGKRGASRRQPGIILALQRLAQANGYQAEARGKAPGTEEGAKTFMPDLVADPLRGTSMRVFEVEFTINNNTVFKSLVSLLSFLARRGGDACLVVPDKRERFAQECVGEVNKIIRSFSKTTKGRFPKVPLSVITFGEVVKQDEKMSSWRDGGKKGRPPVCPFLPFPKM